MTTNEKYINAILDNSPESIVLIGKNHEILAFNKKIQEVLYQYFGKPIKLGDLYYPDFVVDNSKQLYLESFNKAIKGEPVYVQHQTNNDSVSIWFEYKVLPVYDEEGEMIGVTLSAKNIDKEKKAEIQIKTLSNTLKAILDNTDESITMLDSDYKIIALNSISKKTIKKNTNLEAEIGTDFRKFLPDPAHPFYEKFPNALDGIASTVELSYENYKGKTLWFQTKFNPVYDESGKMIGVSIFAKDISEKKFYEFKLAESEDRFKKIATLAPIGILITDSRFKIRFANYVAQSMFDFSSAALQKCTIKDLINDFDINENGNLTLRNISLQTDSLFLQNERLTGIRNKADSFDLLLGSSAFYSNNKINFIFVIQDISDLKNKDELISKQSKALRDIAWHQSHIIRAPVARIMGLIYLLEDNNFELQLDERKIMYKSIIDSATELDTVIKDIVNMTE
jgi:two-component system, sporulation sensor kinase E